jgi:hypothetical protein
VREWSYQATRKISSVDLLCHYYSGNLTFKLRNDFVLPYEVIE